jgi:hypothetical protein
LFGAVIASGLDYRDTFQVFQPGFDLALIRRGPWATIQRNEPDAEQVPTMRIDSLAELPGRIAAFNAGSDDR